MRKSLPNTVIHTLGWESWNGRGGGWLTSQRGAKSAVAGTPPWVGKMSINPFRVGIMSNNPGRLGAVTHGSNGESQTQTKDLKKEKEKLKN